MPVFVICDEKTPHFKTGRESRSVRWQFCWYLNTWRLAFPARLLTACHVIFSLLLCKQWCSWRTNNSSTLSHQLTVRVFCHVSFLASTSAKNIFKVTPSPGSPSVQHPFTIFSKEQNSKFSPSSALYMRLRFSFTFFSCSYSPSLFLSHPLMLLVVP